MYLDNPNYRENIYDNYKILNSYLNIEFKESFSEKKFCDELLRNRMLNEMFYEVVPVILHHDDLNSMFYSIENRSPYLDINLFDFVNESSVDDNDYVYLDLSEEDFDPVIFGTSNVTDPESSSDHKVTFRGRADGPGPGMTGGALQAKLLVGGSVVATDSSVRELTDDDAWGTFVWTLSTSQANAISSYTDLRISLTPTDPNTAMSNIYCSWVFFECPDAAAAAAATSEAFLLFVD